MIRLTRILVCMLAFMGVFALSAFAVDTPVPSDSNSAAMPSPEMMQEMMPDMMGMMVRNRGKTPAPPSCPKATMNSQMMPMMGQAPMGRMGVGNGMMRRMMDHLFYLDRVQALSLTPEQVEKLRMIRSSCRKDNIRTSAEAKIARLDLQDLLGREDWTVADAEKLIRKWEQLEGDRLVRHLKAVAEARKVLTPEQLQKAAAEDTVDSSLENLF